MQGYSADEFNKITKLDDTIKTENITLTFIEINEIIGEKLPVPSDSAVFKAGYKVEKIDFKTKSVIFSKID